MITSLTPRICCTVAMAPALTEAAEGKLRLALPKSATNFYKPLSVNQCSHSCDCITGDKKYILHDVNKNAFPVSTDNEKITYPNLFVKQRRLKETASSFLRGCRATLDGSINNSGAAAALHNTDLSLRFRMNNSSKVLENDCLTNLLSQTQQALKSCAVIEQVSNKCDNDTKSSIYSQSCLDKLESLSDTRNDIVDTNVSQVPNAKSTSDWRTCTAHDLTNRYTTIERRTQHLIRRLRYMKTRNLQKHIEHQVSSYVHSEQPKLRTLHSACKETLQDSNKSNLLQDAKFRSLSTSALVEYVRKYQSQNVTAANELHYQNSIKAIKSEPESGITSDSCPNLSPQFIPNTDVCHNGKEFSGVSGLYTKFESSLYDLDATESSSGADSGDEITFPSEDSKDAKKKSASSIYSRCDWRWTCDRAAIIARWTWLQAQVSDLEYRIRQQTDIYRQIRSSKGAIVLGDNLLPHDLTSPCKPSSGDNCTSKKPIEFSPACNISNVVNNIDKQSSRLQQSLGNCLSPLSVPTSPKIHIDISGNVKCPNGFVSSNHHILSRTSSAEEISTTKSDPISNPVTPDKTSEFPSVYSSPQYDATCQAARCRPLKQHRKRKLLRSHGLHTTSRKAQRLSTVSCQCYPPQTSCLLCTGRYNNTQSVDPVMMPFIEKVSLLDSSFHSVLSFDYHVPLSVYYDSLLKFGLWPKRPPIKPIKIKKKHLQKPRHKIYSSPLKEVSDKAKRKYGKKNNKWMISNSGKFRKKLKKNAVRRLKLTENIKPYEGGERPDAAPPRDIRKRKKPASSVISTASSESSGQLVTSPASKDARLREATAIRRRVVSTNDYSIDDIVIPYSMASSTRVERLQYKDIDTPKWRKLPDESASYSTNCSDGEEMEDLSDEAFIARHLPKLMTEKKRFQNLIQYRRNVRTTRNDSGSSDFYMPGDEPSTMAHLQTTDSADIPVNGRGDDRLRELNDLSTIHTNGHKLRSLNIDESAYRDMEPWPKRHFPLDEEMYQQMVSQQPSLTRITRSPAVMLKSPRITNLKELLDTKSMFERGVSPVPSLASVSNCDDDPLDPEWTMTLSADDLPTV